MLNVFLAFLLSFVIGIITTPFIIKFVKKLHASQTILHYVTTHKNKNGTPTLGGLIFILSTMLSCFFFFDGQSSLAIVAIMVFLSFSFLGFLDDYIKIRTHKNMGLKAYQKALGQLSIAIIVAIFVYLSDFVGCEIYLPFSTFRINIGWLIIPFVIFVYLAMTNSCNLTDGLDGLAGGVSFVALLTMVAIVIIYSNFQLYNGSSIITYNEYNNLAILGASVAGGVLAFLCFNSHKASIFMGDTGSLGLGAILASIAIFSGQALVLPIICIMFVVSAVSVIIQVVYFKLTGKRIFLMSPLHHHFEQKGINENKIVSIYIIITFVICIISVLLYLLGVGFV